MHRVRRLLALTHTIDCRTLSEMNRLILLSGAALLHLFHSNSAEACGTYVPEVFPLLPQNGAEAVPLNAVLIAAANYDEPRFALRVVERNAGALVSGEPDAGALETLSDAGAEVAVSTECERGSSLFFCRARIDGGLQPNTDYEWKVRTDSVVERVVDSGWRRFRTGSTEAARLAPPDIPVRVVMNDYAPDDLCGGPDRIALELDPQHVDQAYAVDLFGLKYHSWSHARVVQPGTQPVTTQFNDPVDCVDVAAFDVIGERYELRRVCFDDELPLTRIEDAGAFDFTDDTDGADSAIEDTTNAEDRESDARAPVASDAGSSSDHRDAGAEAPPSETPSAQPPRKSGGCTMASLPGNVTGLWGALAVLAGLLRRRVRPRA